MTGTHEGMVAVVSGAARGIGRVLAEGLAARGAHLVAVDVLDPGETAAAVVAAGGTCRPLVADVGAPADVERIAAEVGRCDVLVNNAALLGSTPFLELHRIWLEFRSQFCVPPLDDAKVAPARR